MSNAPATLVELADYWKSQGGVNLGIVGNAAHTQGYHLGKDRIYDGSGPGVGDADYSVQLPRDKAGLTNAASAIDLGRLDGTLGNLRKFSNWLVARGMADAAVRKDFREIIYSPDGQKVQRWDARANVIRTGPGQGDDSHLTHTHISFMRDSQGRDKVWLFSPYFTEVPDVPTFKAFAKPKYTSVPSGAWIYVKPDLSPDSGNIQVNPGRDMPVAGKQPDGTLVIGYVDTTPTETELPTYYFRGTVKDYPTGTTPVPPDAVSCKPFTDPLTQQIEQLKADLANAPIEERDRIAEAEADRIRSI